MKSNVYVGVKVDTYKLNESLKSNCDYALLPITNNRYRDSVKIAFNKYKMGELDKLMIKAPELKELSLSPLVKNLEDQTYIGLISSWLELENTDDSVRELSFKVLKHEFEYAKFIGIKQLILAPPHDLNNIRYYAQMISRLLNDNNEAPTPLLSISLPLLEDTDPLSTWELWNTIRKLCGYHQSLTVSLALPRSKTPSYVLSRWLSEPVSCLLVSSSIFSSNQYNYPVLNKFNQNIITQFQKVNGNSESILGELTIILHGIEKYSNQVKGGDSSYLEYINYLLKKGDKLIMMDNNPSKSIYNVISPQLMTPLKPHLDDLTNDIYQIFEKDRVKYELYENAIYQACQDIINEQHDFRLHSNDTKIIILVAGAGRGPLVDRVIQVLKRLSIENYRLIAVEKNPHACLYLQKRNFDLWSNNVEIVQKDMRNWEDPIQVDLCISELLGSFGSNELSPECLHSIELYHSKPSTKFIPESYTSYIAPVSCPLLYQRLSENKNGLESPWIAYNIQYSQLSNKIHEVWKFQHPSKNSNFNRNTSVQFKIKHTCEIHGLMGYFSAILYSNVTLSIIPNNSTVRLKDHVDLQTNTKKFNHTPEMNSWSPIFFPIKHPIFVNDNTELEVFITRINNLNRVWYEWSLSSFVYLVVTDSHKNSKQEVHPHNISSISNTICNIDKKFGQSIKQSFGHFQPSNSNNPYIHSDDDNDDNDNDNNNDIQSEISSMYENQNTDHTFDNNINGWQSLRDIHGLGLATIPVFEQLSEDHGNSTVEEYHVRVETNSTELHNSNGRCFHIPLK